MPNFTPNSKIYIGRVPFDSSYRHTMTFTSAAEQQIFFKSVCTAALDVSTYTYVRMNNSIRVPFNAESLYTYNYVMYQNANYGTKWFYAFIVAINYINENCTELVLKLDVMQTWYFDYSLSECFVEREHVNDDSVGTHINPEPSMELEYAYDAYSKHLPPATNEYYVVLLVTAYPCPSRTTGGSYWYAGSGVPVSGDIYMGQYSACKVLLFKMWVTGQLADFQKYINFCNSCGIGDSIVDAYTVPHSYISDTDVSQFAPQEWIDAGNYPTVYALSSNVSPLISDYAHTRPNKVGTYTPHNNKLLCYPYCYLEIGDFTGRKQDYRWEFFGSNTCHLQEKVCAISDHQGYVIPRNYNGLSADWVHPETDRYVEPFTFDFNNKLPWMFSTYLNWAAQNQTVNQLAILGSTASIVSGIAPGVSLAAAEYGKGINSLFPEMAPSMAAKGFKEGTNKNMVAGGVAGLAGTLANIDRMRRIPNSAKGNTAGNSRFQNGYLGWYSAYVYIRQEFAEIVDGFFDMYGYQVDSLKVPNRTGRTYWNYVKCQNSCHHGNVPADDMALINSIYDKGITFWHTSDVGNYSLSNSIVTP